MGRAAGTSASSDHRARDRRALLILSAGLVAAVLLSVLIGRYPRPGLMPLGVLRTEDLARRLVWELRVPRVLLAALVGAALAAGGVVMQTLFANPLVEPGIVGVSQGAALGAGAAILAVGASPVLVQGAAALGGIAGIALTYWIARRVRFGGWILRLVLSGIAVSAILSAGVGLIQFVADPLTELPAITFWLLGGLWSAGWSELARVAPPALAALLIVYGGRWRLNVLSLHDRVSFTLGAAPTRERLIFLGAATIAVSAVVSVAGIVSWVGLLVPHAARRLYRADTAVSLPAAALLGAIFVVLTDTVARTVLAGEIPLGVLTAFLGAGGFIALLTTNNVWVRR
jgi:iron complex transport system permease protein